MPSKTNRIYPSDHQRSCRWVGIGPSIAINSGLVAVLYLVLLIAWVTSATVLASTCTPVDINQATAEQLAAELPGIGPVKAAAIVDWRTRNGAFTALDELLQIRGIGPATLERLRPCLSVGSAESASLGLPEWSALRLEALNRAATRRAVARALADAARLR